MAYVYKYTDLADNIVKYVGIVCRDNESAMELRLKEHIYNDVWMQGKHWRLEYINVATNNDASALEAHFIAKYETAKWYNSTKDKLGLLSFVKDCDFDWQVYKNDIYVTQKEIIRGKEDKILKQVFRTQNLVAEKLSQVTDTIKLIDSLLLAEDYSHYPKEVLLSDRDKLIAESKEYIRFQTCVPLHLI